YILFPYLHGIEYANLQMSQYFSRSTAVSVHPSLANPSNAGEGGGSPPTPPPVPFPTPSYRGLVWVADECSDDGFFDEDDGLQDEMLIDDDDLDMRRPSDTSIQSSPSNYSLLRPSTSTSATPSIASSTVTSLPATISEVASTNDSPPPQYLPGTFRLSELIAPSENRFLIP